jgi:hypothetical protein
MTKRTKLILVAVAAVVLVAGGLVGVGCRPTTHPVKPADLGTARSSKEMIALLDEPGPVTLETLASADWEVPLSGLLNLDHPKAKLAGLVDRPEPIQIYFHANRAPDPRAVHRRHRRRAGVLGRPRERDPVWRRGGRHERRGARGAPAPRRLAGGRSASRSLAC